MFYLFKHKYNYGIRVNYTYGTSNKAIKMDLLNYYIAVSTMQTMLHLNNYDHRNFFFCSLLLIFTIFKTLLSYKAVAGGLMY